MVEGNMHHINNRYEKALILNIKGLNLYKPALNLF